ncbi:CHAD domain-containing protein [Aquisalinus flavus]|uniref:CHAD domain-containing protein n=1 Tax=Aquisalinus flavus TaxID=1526572 RepID=A0A8J2V3W6_9PROT|nr:CHAD domain-containing protein [Aquisalinus flavus]MBD0426791.1 CHAD domain-containing protein [Aquisalinus flavus]UNE46642.1 CHAD domain-containing protein [Aquisalinus flavus]GGC96045.1 CHAD domain-containing protein [Aquisalinus flavus]
MSYHLKLKDKSVQKAVQRMAGSQIGKAIKEIDDGSIPPGKTVHQVRKRCKKLRGLIRLVRPSFKKYSKENKVFRDAGRDLADARDAEVMVETLDLLADSPDDQLDHSTILPLRDELIARLSDQTENDAIGDKLATVRLTMTEALARAKDWTVKEDGFEAMAGGLAKTYRRAQKALAAAEDDPSPAAWHEWRKRVKYHWYHARLLREIWPDMVGTRRELADLLSDLLGDHHDLAVFARRMDDWETIRKDPRLGDLLRGAIAARQEHLLEEALPLGRRLFAEDADALNERWQLYWAQWRTAA